MGQEITIVDAFTDMPFRGNPAAVCILDAALDDHRMQQIAAEMNLSETAFLHPEGDGYRLRWFTPISEVKLCGHATLAAAHVLWEREIVSSDQVSFFTLSGTLGARKGKEGIELNFPIETVHASTLPLGIVNALGIDSKPLFFGKTDVHLLMELDSAERIRSLTPNISKLLETPPGRLIVTARSDDSRYDFISRYFAPGVGIPEDPVTGAAHCALASYWGEKLQKKELSAYQASPRGGEMKLFIEPERVRLVGRAVTVLRGMFEIAIRD